LKKKAFNLSEVLLAIAIIGIVAALTIPNLNKNVKKSDLETSFKKGYEILSQAITQMQLDNDDSIYTKFTTSPNNTSAKLKTALMPYFNVINNCTPETKCLPTNMTGYKNYTNKTTFMNTSHFVYKFYVENGMLISPIVSSTLIILWVDTNGYKKGPNRAGYDMFAFQILSNDSLIPIGSAKSSYPEYCTTSSNANSSGFGCANNALYVKDYFKTLP